MVLYECDLCHNQFNSQEEITKFTSSEKGKITNQFEICMRCLKRLNIMKKGKFAPHIVLPKYNIGMYVTIHTSNAKYDGAGGYIMGVHFDCRRDEDGDPVFNYFYDVILDDEYHNDIAIDNPEDCISSLMIVRK